MIDLLKFAQERKDEFHLIKEELTAQYPFTINQLQNLYFQYHQIPINELINLIAIQKKAKIKFPFAEKWFFTDKNLQQASSFELAQYHGTLFSKYQYIADLCCGIGSDLLFLSQNKTKCYAVDIDKDIIEIAKYNMDYFARKNIIYQQIKAEDFNENCQAIFIDPDRRISNKRATKIDDLSPNHKNISTLIQKYHNVAVKLSPLFDYTNFVPHHKGEYSPFSFDFVSVNGELKECLLKTGELKTKKRAVILPKNIIFEQKNHSETAITEIKKWLFEPDPAIIRAHLVNDLAFEINHTRLDKNIALLTTSTEPEEIYGKKYQVIDSFNFNLKTLNHYLKSKNIGIIDIKTKGLSEPVETLRRKLKLKGKEKTTLFIIRIADKHICITCK